MAPAAVIAELAAPELEARLRQARAALEEALSGPRPQEIASAKSEWEALTAELEYARSDARRLRELYQQGTTAKAELEAAESKAAYLERSAEAARKRYELLLAGTRAERVEQARAQVAELEAQLAELRVTAPPTSATLEVLPVRVGDVVGPNQDVAVLTLPNSLYVRFYVPAPWLSFLAIGQKLQVRPDGRPGKSTEGTIEQIARAAEFTPRNVQTEADRIEQVYGVKVRLPAEPWLRAGMTVVGRFEHISLPPPEFQKSGRYLGAAGK
ncbi:MAG: HlyD family secretion protein [Candidatus Sumerlaeaceae bacterium]